MNKTKRKIFETSMKLFAEKGYESTSIEEITATVGVAKGTLYYHFSSKEEIFNFLVEEGMKLLKNSIQIKTAKLDNSIDKIKAIILIQVKVLKKYENLITIVLSQIWGTEERNTTCRRYVMDYIKTVEKIIKEGIRTAIVGKPNVGKSSLLNLMLGENRAIVSNVEGTTRDTIEEYINIKGVPLKIIDTAGIRKTNDEVEKIGVEKSLNISNAAELIIAVFDDSREFDEEDKKIVELIKNKQAIILINKTDMNKKLIINNEEIKNLNKDIIEFSTIEEKGLDELYNTIENMFKLNQIDSDNSEIITNERQKQHILKAIEAEKKAMKSAKANMPSDITAIAIKQILEELAEITGQSASEDIINEIFKKFCLGK